MTAYAQDRIENDSRLRIECITDGASKLNFIEGIRNAGGVVGHCLVIFMRSFEGKDPLEKYGVQLHTLTDMSVALLWGLDNKYIDQETYNFVWRWLEENN